MIDSINYLVSAEIDADWFKKVWAADWQDGYLSNPTMESQKNLPHNRVDKRRKKRKMAKKSQQRNRK